GLVARNTNGPYDRFRVHVTFHHDQPREAPRVLARLVEAVEQVPLVEHRRFGRVEILGPGLAECPAAEADYPTARVVDGEGYTVTETIVGAVCVARHQARGGERLLVHAGLAQRRVQPLAACRGIAD